jgi:hypothetical protein
MAGLDFGIADSLSSLCQSSSSKGARLTEMVSRRSRDEHAGRGQDQTPRVDFVIMQRKGRLAVVAALVSSSTELGLWVMRASRGFVIPQSDRAA